MLYLKQSTAVTVKIGPFLDDTDGKTAETGLSLAQADIRLSKNGADIAQKTSATAPTHDELGIYDCALDATDTGTLGRLQLWVAKTGALPVFHEYTVVTANVWDTLCGASKFDVNVAAFSNVDFPALQKTSLETAVANQLNTAVPGSPTANSINERVKAVDDLISAGTLPATVKATDNIDFSALQKTSLSTAQQADFSATQKTSITTAAGSAVATQLNTAVPGSPTTDSINERIKTVDDLVTAGKIAAQVKGTDDIDFSATQKASLNAATPTANALGSQAKLDVKTQVDASVLVTKISKILSNKQAIIGTQLIIYDNDGTTPLLTFNLKNNLGNASAENVFAREPVT